jgi:hypothetical protein
MMLNGRRLQSLCFLIVFAGASLLARQARADGSVNFDDKPNNMIIQNQYYTVGGSGLQFSGNPNISGGGAHIYKGVVTAAPGSSPNVLISSSPDVEHTGCPLTGTFKESQRTVSLYGGYFRFNSDPAIRSGTLSAFDENGVRVGFDTKDVIGNQTSTPFSVTSQTGVNIRSFTLHVGAQTYTTIDALQFSGGTPLPPPPGPPVVHITNPQQSGFVDTTNSTLLIEGYVDGENVLPDLAVELRLLTPPPLPNFPMATTQQAGLSLNGPSFGGQRFGNLLMGVYQLTVTAWNGAGEGSATVTFTNLPPSLRLPGFQFAAPSGNCAMAVFNDGGRAYFPATNAVIPIPTAIMDKWLTVKSYAILRHDGMLGCPTGTSPNVLRWVSATQAMILGRVQDFERGRIYAMNGAQPHYTPKVFSDAITAISKYALSSHPALQHFNDPYGVDEVGAPGSDPVTYIFGNDPTWLFQRFLRPGFTGEPNTLEVRGRNPNPKLYIERVGGGLVDYKAGARREPAPGDNTPAVWDVFQCVWNTQEQGWTCPVSRPHLLAESTTGVPMYTTGSQIKDDFEFCHHNTPYCVFEHICPQWSAIPMTVDDMGVVHKPIVEEHPGETFPLGILIEENTPSDHVDIQSMGWVQAANNASTDMSWNHENIQGRRTPDFLGSLCEDLFTLSGCSKFGQCGAGSSVGDFACGGWADHIFHMRPLAQSIPDPNAAHLRLPNGVPAGPPFWNLLGNQAEPLNDTLLESPNVFHNQGSSGDMEIEWEALWGRNFINAGAGEFTWPQVGALAFVNGRWMLDCGHVADVTPHPFHAEIHPINTLITSEAWAAHPNLPLPGRVTKAQVWINQLYEGTPFHTTVWAPPRPSPQSELNVLFVNYRGPGGAPAVDNPDGSHTFSFTNYDTGDPPITSPVASTVRVALVGEGVSVSVEGPPGSHGISYLSGQPFYPGDNPSYGSGTSGEFIGSWYVGWSCATVKFGTEFVYTCNVPPS